MWFQLFVLIVSVIVQIALAPKPPKPKPLTITDFDIPTAEVGKPIPVVFGQVLIKGSNVVWYGDFLAVPVKEKSKKK